MEKTEIKDWTVPVDGIINVPDELDPLINKIAFQFQLYNISQRFGEAEMLCRIAYVAQKFFTEQLKPLDTLPIEESQEGIKPEDMYLNMQYYMEYCQRNEYVTPQDWIAKHKHF